MENDKKVFLLQGEPETVREAVAGQAVCHECGIVSVAEEGDLCKQCKDEEDAWKKKSFPKMKEAVAQLEDDSLVDYSKGLKKKLAAIAAGTYTALADGEEAMVKQELEDVKAEIAKRGLKEDSMAAHGTSLECPDCGKTCSDPQKKCPHCGNKKVTEGKCSCGFKGEHIYDDEDYPICPECGKRLSERKVTEGTPDMNKQLTPEEQEKLAALKAERELLRKEQAAFNAKYDANTKAIYNLRYGQPDSNTMKEVGDVVMHDGREHTIAAIDNDDKSYKIIPTDDVNDVGQWVGFHELDEKKLKEEYAEGAKEPFAVGDRVTYVGDKLHQIKGHSGVVKDAVVAGMDANDDPQYIVTVDFDNDSVFHGAEGIKLTQEIPAFDLERERPEISDEEMGPQDEAKVTETDAVQRGRDAANFLEKHGVRAGTILRVLKRKVAWHAGYELPKGDVKVTDIADSWGSPVSRVKIDGHAYPGEQIASGIMSHGIVVMQGDKEIRWDSATESKVDEATMTEINKQQAFAKGFQFTGVYDYDRDKVKARRNDPEFKGYKTMVVDIPHSPLSRGGSGKGYSLFAEDKYFTDKRAKQDEEKSARELALMKTERETIIARLAEIDKVLGPKTESKVDEAKFECIECGKKFSGGIPASGEKKCPGCGGYDVEVDEAKVPKWECLKCGASQSAKEGFKGGERKVCPKCKAMMTQVSAKEAKMDESMFEGKKEDTEAALDIKNKMKSILRKIHKATSQAEIEDSLDKLSKQAIQLSVPKDMVDLLRDEAKRRAERIKSGDVKPEAEADTKKDEELIDDEAKRKEEVQYGEDAPMDEASIGDAGRWAQKLWKKPFNELTKEQQDHIRKNLKDGKKADAVEEGKFESGAWVVLVGPGGELKRSFAKDADEIKKFAGELAQSLEVGDKIIVVDGESEDSSAQESVDATVKGLYQNVTARPEQKKESKLHESLMDLFRKD